MKNSSFRFLILGGLLALLWGCAAQNANQYYFEADSLLREAMAKVGSTDPNASQAFESLAKGKSELMEARYDQAIREFRDSMRISRRIMSGALSATPTPSPSLPPSPASAASVDTLVGSPAPSAPTIVLDPTAAPMPAKHSDLELRDDLPDATGVGAEAKADSKISETKKGLPNNSVAKYLAKKTSKPKIEKPAAVPVPIPSTATEGKAPVPQLEAHADTIDEKPIVTNEIVVASAQPGMKSAPLPKAAETNSIDDKKPKSKEDVQEIAPKTKIPASAKKRVPDPIVFIQDDASLVTEAMTTLNQTAKFLLENPSTTLILQSQLSSHEAKTLADERYQSIKAYLIGRGVPEDQIQMDDQQKRAKISEFLMYLVEH